MSALKNKQLMISLTMILFFYSFTFLNCVFTIDLKSIEEIRIFHWNIDRSGYGGDSPFEKGHLSINEEIVKFVKENNVNIISLNESTNDCKNRGNYINYAKSLAEILDFNYIYKSDINHEVDSEGHQCNDGNGLLYSKNLEIIKSQIKVYKDQCCWSQSRNFLKIVIKISDTKNLTVISSHLEAGKSVSDFILASVTRQKQAEEVVNACDIENNYDCIIVGDFNFPFKSLFSNLKPFQSFNDSMKKFNIFERNTCPWSVTGKYGLGGLDYILSQKKDLFEQTKILGKNTSFYGLSDHYAVFTVYNLKMEDKLVKNFK